MRRLPLVFLALLGTALAGEQQYPLWDCTESVAEYAKKVNLPATKSLDLGNGVKLELVLIPAGQFIMGTPEPTPVDEDGFRKKIITGQVLSAVSSGMLLVLLTFVVVKSIRKRQRPKYSLLWLLALTVMAGGCVLSGLHWRQSAQGLEKAQADLFSAKWRYDFARPHEHPGHLVVLTRPFYVGKFAVTQEQYEQATGTNPSHFTGKNNPVEHVTWANARIFCNKLSGQTKETVRLPTEAEWEFACRAGTTTNYNSGDDESDLARAAWYGANGMNKTHPVGGKEPNAFGLYDMHGNVWQWCQDWYGADYYANSPAENPEGPKEGESRVLRGGSWFDGAKYCRSTSRYDYDIGDRGRNLGFRVVVEPAIKAP